MRRSFGVRVILASFEMKIGAALETTLVFEDEDIPEPAACRA
jgi:hypothetical protein